MQKSDSTSTFGYMRQDDAIDSHILSDGAEVYNSAGDGTTVMSIRKTLIVIAYLTGIPAIDVLATRWFSSIIQTYDVMPFWLYAEYLLLEEIVPVSVILLLCATAFLIRLWRRRLKPASSPAEDSENRRRRLPIGIQIATCLGAFVLSAVCPIIFEFLFHTAYRHFSLASARYFLHRFHEFKPWHFMLLVPAALCEEICYRRVMLDRLIRLMPPIAALVLSALAFGLMHLVKPGADWAIISIDGLMIGLVYLLPCRVPAAALWASTGFHIGLNVSLDVIDGHLIYIIPPSKLSLILTPRHFFRPNVDDFLYYNMGVHILVCVLLYVYWKMNERTRTASCPV